MTVKPTFDDGFGVRVSNRLVRFELDKEGAARDAVALLDVHGLDVESYGAVSGVSIFIASSTSSGRRAST